MNNETPSQTAAPASSLWRVTVEYTMLVVADNERQAEAEAVYNAREDGEPDLTTAREVRAIEDVPPDWRDSLPFGGDPKDERTCRERIQKKLDKGRKTRPTRHAAPNAEVSGGGGQSAENINALVRRALTNLVSSVSKRIAAPCSAMAHEDSAIVDLLEACPDWQPWDEESARVVQEAKAHGALFAERRGSATTADRDNQ